MATERNATRRTFDLARHWPPGAEDEGLERLASRHMAPTGALDLAGLLHDPDAGRLALVSSFGTESAVLLHVALRARPDLDVVFIDTGRHFPETLRYRDELRERLGIRSLVAVRPDAATLAAEDPDHLLAANDPNACCRIRKVFPLQDLLADYDGWITGRKRMHGGSRSTLPSIERDGRHLKVNPLASWDREQVQAYFEAHDLPRHPLEGRGYASIGCEPCTVPANDEANPRAGRWHGVDKTECGIHLGPDGRFVRARPAT